MIYEPTSLFDQFGYFWCSWYSEQSRKYLTGLKIWLISEQCSVLSSHFTHTCNNQLACDYPLQGGAVPLIINTCSSEASRYWLSVLLIYKGVYLLAGLFLAFQTFNVRIKELRDSKVIVISVFATFVISVVLTVIGVFVTDDPNAFYGLLSTLILLLITSVMALLFIPRVRAECYSVFRCITEYASKLGIQIDLCLAVRGRKICMHKPL